MAWSETETGRVQTIETKLNEIQTALNNLATKIQLKNWSALLQGIDAGLRNDLNQLEITGAGPALEAHKTADHHTQYHTDYRGNLRYYLQSRFIASSAGAADAGKPIKLDAAGRLDPSFVELTAEDHGALLGLGDDDHIQYFNATRGDGRYYTETELDAGQLDNRYYTETEADTLLSGVNHGDLENLGNDDHTQYLLIDGIRAMSGALELSNASKITDTADGVLTITNDAEDQGVKFDTTTDAKLLFTDEGGGNLTVRAVAYEMNSASSHVNATGLQFYNFAAAYVRNPGRGSLSFYTEDLGTDQAMGDVNVYTGANTNAADRATGGVNIYTGATTTDGDTGNVTLRTGAAGAGVADAGDILLQVHGANTKVKVRGSDGNTTFSGATSHTIPTTIQVVANAFTVDWADGNIQIVDLEDATGGVTATFSNGEVGSSYILKVIQDSGGGAWDIAAWPGTVKWLGGAAPVITVGNDAIDVIGILYDGTDWLCDYSQDYS